MQIHFTKYQGTGNDFILLNNLDGKYDSLEIKHIQQLCNRKFGIGADGLIKINSHNVLDFEVDYYNADGSKSFCGNGARCSVMFSKSLNTFDGKKTHFMAIDGEHSAEIIADTVSLLMKDVSELKHLDDTTFETNTGSPHYIRFIENIEKEDIVSFGRSIRYNDTYQKEGINVNLAEKIAENNLKVQTYERGVEDETLSCGTGVTAIALALAGKENQLGANTIHLQTKGGNLSVTFDFDGTNFTNIHLIGPAEKVFEGMIVL